MIIIKLIVKSLLDSFLRRICDQFSGSDWEAQDSECHSILLLSTDKYYETGMQSFGLLTSKYTHKDLMITTNSSGFLTFL